MRRLASALAVTVTAVVLLFSYHTSTNSAPAPGTVALAPVVPSPVNPSPVNPSPVGTAGATVAGDVVETRWGPVQVEITVAGGRITGARTLQQPAGNQRDAEINAVAVPQLNSAVVQAQSARIDTVSGATVTSDGYLQSVQSAIDRAHL